MIACARCGAENPAGQKFCGECGTRLAGAEPERRTRKTVTVLFSDLVDSTPLGERLDPEVFQQVKERWFEQARAAIEGHGGTVEKFVGDAVMAVFGVPHVHEDDALRAVRAAMELRERLAGLQHELERDLSLGIQTRTGLNTGEVVTGSQALATGDAVNLAARLEQAADPGEILIGERTYSLVPDAVRVERRGGLALKGKSSMETAYALLGLVPGAPAFARRTETPLVGRDQELRQLLQAFERAARERTCHLFTVLGPAGIGKSRLAAELRLSMDRETAVVQGRCLSYGEGITFWPVAEILRSLPPPEEVLAGTKDGNLIAGKLRSLVGVETGAGVAREESFWAVRKLFEALAEEGPLVIVFDDIHWAEPTLLDLIEHLADWSREAPILVLCLARPDLLDKRPGWGGGKRNATSLFLEPLSEEETEALIDELLSDPRLTPELRRRVAEAAGGNPLFVEQMLAMLGDRPAEKGKIEVPPTIQALLAARLDSLEGAERAVIERAAVCGKEFDRASVEALSEDGDLATVLLSLVRKELLRLSRDEDAFRFAHDLVRDAAYDAIPKQLRAELHERFADWLEETAGKRRVELEEIVGYHLEQASRYRRELRPDDERARELGHRASRYLESAGRRAQDRGDNRAGAHLLGRAARLLPPRTPERVELLCQAGWASLGALDLDRAESTLAEVDDETRRLADRRLELYALVLNEYVRVYRDRGWKAGELYRFLQEEAIPYFEEVEDHAGLALSWSSIAGMDVSAGRVSGSESAWERYREHAPKARLFIDSGFEFRRLHAALFGPLPVDEGIRRCDETALTVAGKPQYEARILANQALLEAMRADFPTARSLFERHVEIRTELGDMPDYSTCALIEMLSGDFAAADRWLQKYDELRTKQNLALGTFSVWKSWAAYGQGRYKEAFEHTRGAEEAAREELDEQLPWRGTRAKLLARQGDFEEAERFAREAVAMSERTDWLEWRADLQMDLAEVLQLAGRPDDAVEPLERALALYEQKGHVVGARRALAALAELQPT